MSGFTDIHAHFIHNLDDGAQSLEMTREMLEKAYQDGVRTLFATPHVIPGVRPFDVESYRQRLEDARSWCAAQGYELTLHEGAEIMYTPVLLHYIRDRQLPTLAASAHVLLEFVPTISCAEMTNAITQLNRYGYRPILAHVERYDCLYRFRNAFRLRKECDVQFQMNCGYLLEGQGFFRENCTESWLEHGLIDYIASDAHDTYGRSTHMRSAYTQLRYQFGKAYADRLMKSEWSGDGCAQL